MWQMYAMILTLEWRLLIVSTILSIMVDWLYWFIYKCIQHKSGSWGPRIIPVGGAKGNRWSYLVYPLLAGDHPSIAHKTVTYLHVAHCQFELRVHGRVACWEGRHGRYNWLVERDGIRVGECSLWMNVIMRSQTKTSHITSQTLEVRGIGGYGDKERTWCDFNSTIACFLSLGPTWTQWAMVNNKTTLDFHWRLSRPVSFSWFGC